MKEETQFQDAEGFNPTYNNTLTFKDIVLQHLKKIGQFASVELRGGYWEHRPNPNPNMNMPIKTYVPDTRDIYCNAIEYLADVLYPYFDEEMKTIEKKIKENIAKSLQVHTRTNEEEENEFLIFKSSADAVSYSISRTKHSRTLFRALCSFLYRKKYLEVGTLED